MRFRFGLAALMAVALVGIVACGQDSTDTVPAGLNTPDIQATVTALALSQAQALTPTPVPPGVRQELLAFAAGHQAVLEDWDRFHGEMDQWRDDVVACVPASYESALNAFAGRALGITQAARSLERLPALETLAARLSAAAELEEVAFETLSNNWQPDGRVSSSASSQVPELFHHVASVRTAVELEREIVARSLSARRTSLDSASLAAIEEFVSEMELVDSNWNQFHGDYDVFRAEQVELGDEVAASRLGGLLTQFGSIVERVQSLPNTLLTREIADQLANAADGEQLLLRRLLGSIGGEGALIETVPLLPGGLAITGPGEGETGASGLVLEGATVFDVFDTQIALVNRLRRERRNDLNDARASLTGVGQENLTAFLKQVRPLDQEWDELHSDYDDWRRTNGGCDQGQALAALGELATRFSETVRDVKNLPSPTLVRETGEILIQAVEREQAAVLSLRETWRSQDTSAFGRYTADRAFAETLRRQVALDLQDLLAHQGLSGGS